jgi:hypothetical protein
MRDSPWSSPDRFIPSRSATPVKEKSMLSLDCSDKNGLADPFGPVVSRKLRTVERYATIRSPPTTPRAVGIGSRVRDAQHTPTRAASTGSIWTVGGSIVTEGVASTTNASHYTADFLRKNTPSDEEFTHGQRVAVAMEIDQSARILDHGSPPSSPGSPQSPGSGGSGSSRVWRNGIWDKDGFPTRVCT